ncbi:uncharacterized protein LOC112462861 isoform X2 [Temnothorax curvispinosus]|uniref:Uncharacterized protein LOC112462861 isoform X2 n=1 Tax=Temnothorax curvispinosus TaxID=300111 RepID=A0A6J1QQD4_9HYME|nr:uncharacterized protein LOC112462861 isoform X2 [Temnothorax curvispinosus]
MTAPCRHRSMHSAWIVTLVQQQHQMLDGNHHQGQKEQDNVNGTVESAESHAVDRFRGEAGCSVKEIAVVAPDNESVGDSSTQCSDVIDDDNEEEEMDVEESGAGGWIMNPPVSTIVQQHQAFDTTNGYIALPNPDSSNFSDVRMKDSSNVHLGNEVNYNGPVTINHVVYTNPTPNQDAIELDVIRPSDNISDLSTNKDNGAPNGCIFPQYTKLNKVTQWLWTWKRAVLSCVKTLILLAIVVPITVHFIHQLDASVSPEIPTSSNEGSFLPSVRPTTGTTRSPPTPAPTRPSGTPSSTNTCKAPPQPQNGRWKLHRSQCSDGQDCNVPEGTELGLGSYLVYSCDSGYKIRGSPDVSCSIGGKWLNIPVCRVESSQNCTTASTTWIFENGNRRGRQACPHQLIFEDNFDNLNATKWNQLNRFSGPPDYEFVVYMTNEVTDTSDGRLRIKPILLNTKYGTNFVLRGTLKIENCTGEIVTEECYRVAAGFYILPPLISGRINTKGKFEFLFGRVEIRAKLPHGDWVYPVITLESAENKWQWGLHHEIRIASSVGNEELRTPEGETVSGHILAAGGLTVFLNESNAQSNNRMTLPKRQSGETWSDYFHIYEIEWKSGLIVAKVDGVQYGEQAVHGSFGKPSYLTLGVAVGGIREFEDHVTSNGYTKPWRNVEVKALYRFYLAINHWHPTWDTRTVLQVDYVKVWAL